MHEDPTIHSSARGSRERRSVERVADAPPARWGPLELLEKVGEGAFGETFRARDPRLERDVALKLLKKEASRREGVAGRVIREGALLARVGHPNVVTVYGAEKHDERVGLWMEFVRGRTLAERLDHEGAFGEREATLVGLDLCRALAAVHAAGIVHRDIKSENVMREDGGRLVLMDFGAGLDLGQAGAARRELAGTPLYMAPEVLRREPATNRSDLYSLGVLLYHLVTRDYPVTARSLPELIQAHERPERRHLRDARPDLSGEFAEIIGRCLETDPAARVETAGALEAALARTITRFGVESVRESQIRASGLPESALPPSPSSFDFEPWRRARVAEWSRPRYRLDEEFVSLSLLVDQGEESAAGRWRERPERHRDLANVLAAVDVPALVLLGSPGCGKSTLLRRFELDTAERAFRGETDAVTFFVQLNHFRKPPEEPLPDPRGWLSERWRARYPELPTFGSLLRAGRMVLLLDSLNEMPVGGARELREAIVAWKEFLGRLVEDHPGNRVVFACRSLDYSAPLSTPSLRVPQIVIEPMSDEQVEQYLAKHLPGRAQELWSNLRGTDHLEVMRSPYFLSLLVEQVETGQVPTGRAGLFTGFVRQALRRELERDNPLFSPNGLLDERDVRRVTQWRWKTPWELPERGVLVPKLTTLAFSMQDRDAGGGASQVRIGFDDALRLLDDDRDEDIVRAGVALAVLDEDAANDEILFFHQLLQEYFAARRLGAAPDPARVAAPWKAADVTPRLEEMIATLPAGEALPALPTTGWEETALLATAMTTDPDAFLTGLQRTNLALAGRCASQAEVRARVSRRLRDEIRAALVTRSRAPDADLRARIDAGLALGELGDPRFERGTGPDGEFLLPPLVDVPGGRYPIGEDAPVEYLGLTIRSHAPRHEVVVAPFRIGRFPVTNAEWACFEEGGGYDDERWWDTAESRRWRSGEGTADGARMVHRYWRERFRADPALLESAWRGGQLSAEGYEQWRRRMEMSEEEFAEHLRETFPGGRLREPKCWRDARFNNPAQPVVGVSWFEARAYCSWLAAQSGIAFRLPTEVEWEAAARGREGRDFASGGDFDAFRGNTVQTLLKRTSPVGVFPSGDTPEGVSDLAGNVEEWTSSLFGPGVESEQAPFRYPYAADDGREDPQAPADVRRVLRGGAWHVDRALARAAARLSSHPAVRENECGFRAACG